MSWVMRKWVHSGVVASKDSSATTGLLLSDVTHNIDFA